MKGSYIQLEQSQNSLGLVPCRLKNKKSLSKPGFPHDLDILIPDTDPIGRKDDKMPLSTINMSIYNLKNTYRDKKKIKDAVTVKKMNLFCKENIDSKKIPVIINIIKRNSLNISNGIQFHRRNSQKNQNQPKILLKKSCIFPQHQFGLRTFTTPMSPNKQQINGKSLKLQKLQKETDIPQSMFEAKHVVANSKSEALINIKLKNYISFIKQGRKFHNLIQQIIKQPRKKALKVRIKKGNNSQLVKWLFKKRWWWSIEDQKQNKQKVKPNFTWSQLKQKVFFQNEKQSINLEGTIQESSDIFAHNHFPQNQYLGNKKALFYNMSHYYNLKGVDVFDKLPLTYHVISLQDVSWKNFTQRFEYNKNNGLSNIWILKPGQNSNRGRGITVHQSYQQMKAIVGAGQTFIDNSDSKTKERTYIIQSYIDKPFLYNKRKFDIRSYMLLVNINKTVKGYWYSQGYIRTSSFQFQLNDFNTFVHLTNDAIQTHSQNYGKYEDGNKLSYSQFQKYLDSKFPGCGYDIEKQIVPQMKQIATQSIKAAIHIVKGKNEAKPVFQVFGLDFMIDKNFKPWLIEINTNPCIETSCLVLEKVIPRMLDDAFKLSIDLLFPPPENWPSSRKYCLPSCQNKFELVYDDSKNEQPEFRQQDFPSLGVITQDGEVYDQNQQ